MNMNKKGIVGISLCAAIALQALGEETSLGTVDVVSTNQDKESYTVESMNTSTKLNLSIKDTPQSVSVVTKEELEDRDIDSYQEFLRNLNGVSLERWDERVNAHARGFEVDYYQIDGKPTSQYIYDRDPDLSIFERVEVVKGANGLTNGSGNPAMSMNFVRKRADSKETTGYVDLELGSWNTKAITADVSTPITKDGKVRSRVVVKHQDGEYFLDDYEKEKDVIYGVVDADLSDTSKVSVGYSYEDLQRSNIRWGGNPAFYSDGTRADFDLSKNPTENWTYWDVKTSTYFADFEQYFKNDIKLDLSYSNMKVVEDDSLLYFGGKVDKSDGSGLSYYTWDSEIENEDESLDLFVSIPFSQNNLDHELIVGYSYNKSDMYKYKYYQTYGSLSNFYNIDVADPDTSYGSADYDLGVTTQKSYYTTVKYSLDEKMKFILGARLLNYDYDQSEQYGSASTTHVVYDNEFTPFIGLTYDLNKKHSLYASYTTIFKAQTEKDVDGNYHDPKEGNTYEIGMKSELFDGALNTSATIFRINQDNVAEEIDGVYVTGSTTEKAYSAAEGVTSKGVELSASGNINDKWSVSSGLTNFEAKDKDGNKVSTKSSRTNINLFTKYKFDKYSIGGGLNYRSKFYTGSGTSQVTQGGYTLVELMGDYQIRKDLKLQANIANLFDKRYYEGIGANSMSYGDPRNYSVSLKYTF